MFGIELNPILLSILIFEGILLFSQLIVYLARPKDVSRKRFFILVVLFFQFTLLCSLMPSESIKINLFFQHIIIYLSSIVLAYGYFNYLIKELELPQLKMYNIKVFLLTLGASFLFFFIILYLATQDIYLTRMMFDLVPILVSFYFCYQTVYFLTKKWRALKEGDSHHGTIILAGNIGIIFMATMPITDILDKSLDQVLNISLVSVSLIVTFYAYIKNFFYQSKLEYQFLDKIGFLTSEERILEEIDYKNILLKYNLTSRELDVALLILEEKSYREIGDGMFLNHKTISKHASNIFRKTNCSNKNHFIQTFSKKNEDDVIIDIIR